MSNQLSPEHFHYLENFGHSLRAPSYTYKLMDAEQIADLLRLARQNGLTVTPRGAGRS
jgi:FAD/FMN-containing dehydrogenase